MHTDLLHLQRYHESGDAGEFQALVQQHAGMVFSTARRVTCDSALAEDVAQETFLELARKGRSITESVGAWLHRVAWRRACDVVRAETTRQRYESAAVSLEQGSECTWEELEPVFDEALSELAPKERGVIVEHYLEGRTQVEIADRMGLSQPSVSRLLDHSMEQLRSRLKNKGLFCGVALGSMMTASSSQAAPAMLMASLHKIGMSSIGSAAAATTGGKMLGLLAGLSLKTIAVCAAALAACILSYDLASKDSWLAGWFAEYKALEKQSPSLAAQNASATDSAATKARLLAEAQAIWARKPNITKDEMQRLMSGIIYEKDNEKRFMILRDAGVLLSRGEYDGVVARHPDVHLFDERRAFRAVLKLHHDLVTTWALRSPREAVVWTSLLSGNPLFPAILAPWVRSHPDEWAAFVEAGPDPRLGEYAKLWIEDLKDPGSIWTKAKEAGLDTALIQGNLDIFVMTGNWPEDAVFQLILRSPNAKARTESMAGMALKLSNEQLLEAAGSGVFQDPGWVNTLRAMGGDPDADFGVAAAWVTTAANGGGDEAQLAVWAEELAGRFYAQWLQMDARAALQHAKRSRHEILFEKFMEEGAKSAMLNEALIVESLSSVKNRDQALAAYYQAKAGGDPEAALQAIMNSSYVEDEVESARQVLNLWAIKSAPDAAAWVASLPASEGREELLAAVTSKWAETAPEAAFSFALQQGAGLDHGWADALAWGARALPEDKLAAMFAKLRQDPQYNTLVTRLVSVRCPSHPEEAFALLSKYAEPGWQTPLINDMIRWLEQDDARAEGFAVLLPTLELSLVDPESLSKAARLFVQMVANKGNVQAAFDWTLKLPGPVAQQVRSEAIVGMNLSDAQQRNAAEQWIRSATISEGERVALLHQAGQMREVSAEVK